jgi:hypothetical protein
MAGQGLGLVHSERNTRTLVTDMFYPKLGEERGGARNRRCD